MGNRKFYKMEEIEALGVEEVHKLYKEYINPNSWTWVIVGDLSKIEEGIKNLNIGPVKIIEL